LGLINRNWPEKDFILKNRWVRREKDAHFLLAAVILIILTLFSRGRDNLLEKQGTVRDRAEILGYQVFQIYRDSLKSRGPNGPINEDSRVRDDSSSQLFPGFDRGPASVADHYAGWEEGFKLDQRVQIREGFIGMDPWGHAFNYRITFPDEKSIKVSVWSMGPGGIKEETNKNDKDSPPITEFGSDLYLPLNKIHL